MSSFCCDTLICDLESIWCHYKLSSYMNSVLFTQELTQQKCVNLALSNEIRLEEWTFCALSLWADMNRNVLHVYLDPTAYVLCRRPAHVSRYDELVSLEVTCVIRADCSPVILSTSVHVSGLFSGRVFRPFWLSWNDPGAGTEAAERGHSQALD